MVQKGCWKGGRVTGDRTRHVFINILININCLLLDGRQLMCTEHTILLINSEYKCLSLNINVYHIIYHSHCLYTIIKYTYKPTTHLKNTMPSLLMTLGYLKSQSFVQVLYFIFHDCKGLTSQEQVFLILEYLL